MNKYSEKQIDRLWEWLLHEDNLFTSRANFFLIAESMLFAAFAVLIVNTLLKPCLMFVLGGAGVIFTIVWLYWAIVQIYLTINPIKAKLQKLLPEWSEIASGRRKVFATHLIFGIFLPSILLTVWIILITTQIIPPTTPAGKTGDVPESAGLVSAGGGSAFG